MKNEFEIDRLSKESSKAKIQQKLDKHISALVSNINTMIKKIDVKNDDII